MASEFQKTFNKLTNRFNLFSLPLSIHAEMRYLPMLIICLRSAGACSKYANLKEIFWHHFKFYVEFLSSFC